MGHYTGLNALSSEPIPSYRPKGLVCAATFTGQSLDDLETFDVGEDTGTPVLEEYESQMPFRFDGTLNKFAVVLQPEKLSDEERRQLHEDLAKALAAVQ
jgi:hypothetical protein